MECICESRWRPPGQLKGSPDKKEHIRPKLSINNWKLMDSWSPYENSPKSVATTSEAVASAPRRLSASPRPWESWGFTETSGKQRSAVSPCPLVWNFHRDILGNFIYNCLIDLSAILIQSGAYVANWIQFWYNIVNGLQFPFSLCPDSKHSVKWSYKLHSPGPLRGDHNGPHIRVPPTAAQGLGPGPRPYVWSLTTNGH